MARSRASRRGAGELDTKLNRSVRPFGDLERHRDQAMTVARVPWYSPDFVLSDEIVLVLAVDGQWWWESVCTMTLARVNINSVPYRSAMVSGSCNERFVGFYVADRVAWLLKLQVRPLRWLFWYLQW